MKKFFLILIFALLFCNLYAQQRDFTFLNHRIDSLTQVYSTKEWQEMIYGNYFDNTDLSAKEKEELIAKIRKLFEQKEYANLYCYGHRIIYDMWWGYLKNNSFEIKQKLIELYLQYYFYPGNNNRIINSYGYDKERNFYFTEKSKQRIVEILENKKTEKEYEAWLNYEKSIHGNIIASRRIAEKLLKRQRIQNDTIIQQIRDSIYTEYVTKDTQKMLESQQIEPDLIRMIGSLDMKECIPILKQNLQSCIQKECQGKQIKAYRYALARLGDKEQRQYILDNLINIDYSDSGYFERRDFAYFQDDEMIWRYIEVNYHSNKSISPLSDVYLPASFMTINNIYPYIKNLPQGLIYPEDDRERTIRFAWSKSVYDWLMANKDIAEFDYEGEKDFPW